ncbi:hypothetical protein NDN08_003344 [Rhodosorus marinus]|uniref:Calcium-binding protein n=1 Tax=Rhodosorus marinus TaxID=101924 RepID=A0AAV8UW88_9RHOD|nr:hypothetical protein NDN08_003344 [Rhodosorus marinus]
MSAGINPECDGKPQFQKRRTVDKARGIDGFKQLIVDWDEIPASSPGCCETTRCLDFKATVVDPNDLVTMTDVVIDDPGCGLAGECEIQITCPNLVTTGMRGIGLQGRQVYSGTDFDDVIILPETHPRELYAYGNPGNDYFIGSEDPDRIHGNGSGNDIMLGNGGDDFLYPAEGADRVFGGDGNDQFRFLDPDGSVDLLSGGDGVDTVTFAFLTSSLEPIDVLKSVEIVEQP